MSALIDKLVISILLFLAIAVAIMLAVVLVGLIFYGVFTTLIWMGVPLNGAIFLAVVSVAAGAITYDLLKGFFK
jgi:hypothetical protein